MIRVLRQIAALLMLFAGMASATLAKDGLVLKPFDAASPEQLRRTQTGRAYLLVFWSLYCDPCREEMAHWGALQRKHPAVPIVLVSTDGAAERTNVEKFLRQQNLGRVQTWLFADEFVERIRYAIDPKWRGELPRTYFVDAAHRPKAHSGRIDAAAVSRWMAEQTAQSR